MNSHNLLILMTKTAIFPNGIMLVVAIFFLLFNTCYGVVVHFTEVTPPLSWDEAFLSGKCHIQSDVTGDVDSNSVNFNHALDNVTEAWVGMFAFSSDTLLFESCRVYTAENILAGSTGHFVFDNQTDVLGSCYRFCNSSRFGLSNDTCFCLEDDLDLYHPSILEGTMCQSGYEALCGSGPTLFTSISIILLCTYRPVNVSVSRTGLGDCATYNTASRQTNMVDCALKKDYVCDEVGKNKQKIIPSETESGWWEAARKCTELRSFFGNETSLTRYVESSSTTFDSYWTNVFRRTSFSFESPGEVEHGRCVAVRNNSGIFTLFVQACNLSLPALCSTVNTKTPTPLSDVTTLVKTDVTTPTRDVTGAPIVRLGETEPVLWPLAFVAVGIVLIVVVSVILYHKKRVSTREMKSSKLIKHMSYGSRLAKPETNQGFKSGNALSYETSFIETEPNHVSKTKTETLSVSSNNDTTESKQVNTTGAETPPDDIYNELNEKKTDDQTDDIYDHTRDINVRDDTYDGFRRSDSLGNNGTADCLEYDTMANIKAQSTGNSNIYDSCLDKRTTNAEVTDFNEYDSMANINAEK
ncbi:uncharacterized protein LOC110449399 [Mizuhopecten yessoensis]|uniref:WSC domain-containing protein n=1 Tax=Mizuhopecten yessoensis TaxID=6573 RepID=A0A210QRC8_MIZYE|nr:uncharacterized protein LOC110449399 [Mizuhopecten yessoensis]OWF51271.1 hypothetical protein KP79_PYT24245 [Mizuhopecten yessoensis]